MKRDDARLLLVDDSASMRTTIRSLLRGLGFPHIDEAADGNEAFSLFLQHPYDVVITDWYMPRFTGIELLRAIRTGLQRQATPVLVLTGSVTRGCLREAIAAGANGFIPKPFVGPSLGNQMSHLMAIE